MKVEETVLTNYQVKQLFEEFNSRLFADGVNPKYSWFMFKNTEMMAEAYNRLMMDLYDERREPEYREVFVAQKMLQDKYADRDAEGKPVLAANGFPVYTEHAQEYDEAFAKLREDYKEFFEKLDKKEEINREIYNRPVTIMATKLEISEFPNNTKPFIVGLLGY